MTAGPWKPVRLEVYESRIEDVWTTYTISNDLRSVQGSVHAQIQGHLGAVHLRLLLENETLLDVETSPSAKGLVSVEFSLGKTIC